jgi:hypothetical protein
LILGGHQFQFGPEIVAFFRIHAAAKGTTQFRIASRELFELYAMIALRPDLPPSVRRLAIRSMRDQCGHMFAQSQWDLFASFVRTLARVHGLSQVGGPLLLRYLLTYLGSRNVVRLRTVYHGVMR